MADSYLLDANVLSDLLKNPVGQAAKRMALAAERNPRRIFTSVIVAAEMHYGAKKKNSEKTNADVRGVLANVEILPLGLDVIEHYARIRVELERAGTIIGANDLMIAAHALAADLILVTHNRREFSRVRGLRYEDWLENSPLT
jgi:tRNA(fMet)-specific endonuclease VapC